MTLSWILGFTVAGLGWSHSAPTLLALHPQQSKSAAQVSSGSLLTPSAASMQATESPSTLAVPAAVADPAVAAGPTPTDTPMLPTEPLLMPPEFPDPAVSSAMCLWAEDVDIPVAVARQPILYVHANFVSELSQHPSSDCLCLSKPLQELVGTAVRAVTDAASFPFIVWLRRSVRQLRSGSSLMQHCGRRPLHAKHISNSNYGSPQTVRQAAQTSRRVLESAPCSPWGAQ